VTGLVGRLGSVPLSQFLLTPKAHCRGSSGPIRAPTLPPFWTVPDSWLLADIAGDPVVTAVQRSLPCVVGIPDGSPLPLRPGLFRPEVRSGAVKYAPVVLRCMLFALLELLLSEVRGRPGGGREGPGGAGRRWFRPVVLAATVLAAIYVFWCSPGRSTLHIYIYIHLLVAARALCYLYVIYIYIASGASGAAVGVAAGSRAAVGAVGPGGPRHSAATSDQMRNLAVHPWSSFRTDCRSQGVAAGVAGCPHLACGACRRNVRGPGGTAGDATVRAVRRAICR